MDDLSAFLKKGFQNQHKNALDKAYKQKTIKDRREDLTSHRRKTRDTLMLQKRNIDLNNFTPEINQNKFLIKTSVHPNSSQMDGITGVVGNSKRLEMLKKWKYEKEKKKLVEKKTAKPQFKVFHVPVTLGLPDLENVNKVIKGKLIKKQAPFKSNFVPEHHQFKPPKNIAPIPLYDISTTKTDLKQLKSSYIKSVDNKHKLQVEQRKNYNIVTRSEINAKISSKQKHEETEANISQPLKKGLPSEVMNIKEKKNKNCRMAKKDNNGKKGVIWNVAEILESDDEILTEEIKFSSSKKTYTKTPIKDQKSYSLNSYSPQSDSYSLRIRSKAKKNEKPSLSVDIPVNSMSIKHPFSTMKSDFHTPQRQHLKDCSTDDDMIFSKKTSASPSFDNNTYPESDNSVINDDNFIACRSLKCSMMSINKNLDDFSIKVNEENCVLYSDEDMTLKTPTTSRKLRMPETPDTSSSSAISKMSTPKKCIQNESPIYISPFVTISRGKESARKEYRLRLSSGGKVPNSPDLGLIITKNTSPMAAAEYFTKRLDSEIGKIEELCSKWSTLKQEIPDEGQDMVAAAIGQSKLLISKKCQQFKKLIAMCAENLEKSVTCADLHGYWDTMYMQVEDIHKRFNNLQHLQDSGWKEVLIADTKIETKRPKGRPKRKEAQSKIKDIIKKARMNIKKNNCNVNEEHSLRHSENVTISDIVEQPSSTKKKRYLLESTVRNTKLSSSPGMTMLKLSQAIKCGDGLTPSKSILKNDCNRSVKRSVKSVNFKDIKENKENKFHDLSFSPATPRRSKRLSRIT